MKIAIVSLQAYPLFDPTCKGKFGGAEMQIVLVARGLAARGHDVTVITFDHGQSRSERGQPPSKGGQPAEQTFDGVRVIKSVRPVTGRQWIRGVVAQFRVLGLLRSLDPDVILQPSVTGLVLTAAVSALVRGKRAASVIMNDNAFTGECLKRGLDQLSFELGLRLCDAIIVINRFQEEAARRLRFRRARQVSLVGTPCVIPPEPESAPREYVLWVGRCMPIKRPELFVQLAARLPEEKFVMVIPPQDEALFARVQSAARDCANLVVVPGAPRPEMDAYFSRAKLLVNTSLAEGFPTVFVEAGSWACPVVSLKVDPSGFLSEHGLGVACGDDTEKLLQSVDRLLKDPAAARDMGRRALAYVREHHDFRVVAGEYEAALRQMLR